MPARKSSKLDALLKTPQPVPNRGAAKKGAKRKAGNEIELPADGDWRTTDGFNFGPCHPAMSCKMSLAHPVRTSFVH